MKPKTKFIIILAVLSLSLSPLLAYGQSGFEIVKCGRDIKKQGNEIIGECTLTDLKNMTIRVVNYLFAWSWLVALLFILWAGWGMINAGGDNEKITAAKSGLTSAIIGFFIVTVAFILVNLITMILTGKRLRELIDFVP